MFRSFDFCLCRRVLNGQTCSWRALRNSDGRRHSRCRCSVPQKPILGTTDGECGHCLSVRSLLPEILQAFLTAMEAEGVLPGVASAAVLTVNVTFIILYCWELMPKN
jgi:hypothetical protein